MKNIYQIYKFFEKKCQLSGRLIFAESLLVRYLEYLFY